MRRGVEAPCSRRPVSCARERTAALRRMGAGCVRAVPARPRRGGPDDARWTHILRPIARHARGARAPPTVAVPRSNRGGTALRHGAGSTPFLTAPSARAATTTTPARLATTRTAQSALNLYILHRRSRLRYSPKSRPGLSTLEDLPVQARSLAPLAVAMAVALVVAACGGADDTVGGSSSSGSSSASGGSKAQLSLVAYSTPQVVYDEVIPGFEKTEAGSGVSFK